MKRAGSQNASAADSRRAADRLREATDLLGHTQQQDAAGRLGSMAQTADQLATRQKQQADHIRDLIAQQEAPPTPGKPAPAGPSAQDLDKMVNDRQKVADDLAHLTQQIRTAARELAPTQPGASSKLRGALEGLDENDLNTRMQRSSDWLRSGEFSDPLEAGLTSDLQKLGQQVGEAARALGNGQPTSKDAGLNRAIDDLSRLRDQVDRMGRPFRRINRDTGSRGAAANSKRPGGSRANGSAWPKGSSWVGKSGQAGQAGQVRGGGQARARGSGGRKASGSDGRWRCGRGRGHGQSRRL